MALPFQSGKRWVMNPKMCRIIVNPRQFRHRSLFHLVNDARFFIKAGTRKENVAKNLTTTTSTRAISDDSTPFKTTQSKIIFWTHEIATTVTSDPIMADQWICDTCAAHPTTDGKKIVVGLDCEWKPSFRGPDNKIALLQLCVGNRCLILQLIYMNPVPDTVKTFLLDEAITFVGVGVGEDVVKLKENYGLECANTLDLKQACNAFLGIETKICKGLKGYARELLGFEFQKSKSATKSNWERQNLKESQIRYACLDAFISYLLGCKVLEGKSD